MGIIYSLFGILVGLWVAITSIGDGYEWFPLYAGLAAFITAGSLWRIIIERRQCHTIQNGVMIGALSGILSHYVCWYLQVIVVNIKYYWFGTGLSSLGEPPANIFMGITGAFWLSLYSLLFFGLPTVIVGSAVGGFFCWRIQKRREIV